MDLQKKMQRSLDFGETPTSCCVTQTSDNTSNLLLVFSFSDDVLKFQSLLSNCCLFFSGNHLLYKCVVDFHLLSTSVVPLG